MDTLWSTVSVSTEYGERRTKEVNRDLGPALPEYPGGLEEGGGRKGGGPGVVKAEVDASGSVDGDSVGMMMVKR